MLEYGNGRCCLCVCLGNDQFLIYEKKNRKLNEWWWMNDMCKWKVIFFVYVWFLYIFMSSRFSDKYIFVNTQHIDHSNSLANYKYHLFGGNLSSLIKINAFVELWIVFYCWEYVLWQRERLQKWDYKKF